MTSDKRTLALTTSQLLLACLLCAFPAGCAEEDLPLKLHLTVLTERILPCQPLRLIIEARHEGGNPVTGAFALPPALGRASLDISAGTRHLWLNLGDLLGAGMAQGDWAPPAKGITYQAGYREQQELLVVYDFRASCYVFSEPGVYEIQASLQFFHGSGLDDYRPVALTSNVLAVQVAEPEGMEAVAEELWRTPLQAALTAGDSPSFRHLHGAYPDSSYAQYARFALSHDELLSVRERIALLKDLVARSEPLQIMDLALLQLSELLYARGEYENCKVHAARVLEMPTSSDRVRDLADSLVKRATRALEE